MDYAERLKRVRVWPDGLDAVEAAHAIDRFADWLNQPTLAQRFEAFKRRVTDLVSRMPVVTAVFDCDQKKGPHVWLSCPGTMEPIGFNDAATDDQIRSQLQYWAKYVGRQYLRGELTLGARGPASGTPK